MKCFECGQKTITVYWNSKTMIDFRFTPNAKITAVNKVCPNCNWSSNKVKIPEPIKSIRD